MKQFIVDRHTTPNTPTLEQVPTEKIPIYENRAAVEADLANLAAGQIVATKDTGDELAQPVNVVESGNLHAVSSDAVAKAIPKIENKTITVPFWGDYSYKIVPSDLGLTTFKDVYLIIHAISWKAMADIQSQSESEVIVRAWKLSDASNATVTLINSGNLELLVTVIHF